MISNKYKILVLTDHTFHSAENSLYALVNELRKHPGCQSIHIASRGNANNHSFFLDFSTTLLYATPVVNGFKYTPDGSKLLEHNQLVDANDYDVIWLRMPRPINDGFFEFLQKKIGEERIINRPSGIKETGSKAFLIHFEHLCPPIKHCKTVEDILKFQEQFPIVLKPIENYGGQGILKMKEGHVYEKKRPYPLEEFLPQIEDQLLKGGYLGMKYLKNVKNGDKRIVVVNGKVLGAALRVPPKHSWLCNAAQGGTAFLAEPDKHELWMVDQVHQVLSKKGIVMFGMDTLEDDQGHRVLSEINTLSIGGVKQMEELSGKPLVNRAARLLMRYIKKHIPSSMTV